MSSKQCPNCLLDLSAHGVAEGAVCPNCGANLASSQSASSLQVVPVAPGAAYLLFERFWQNLRDLVFRPTVFFSKQGPELVKNTGLSSALAFAVIIQWIASFLNFIWSSTLGIVIQSRINDILRIATDVLSATQQSSSSAPLATAMQSFDRVRTQMYDILFGAGAVVLSPFLTLIHLGFIAAIIHLAARFFIRERADRPLSYTTTLKILAYATAPWILCVIPFVGAVLAWVLVFFCTVAGIREVYQSTTFRATIVTLFPEILVLTFVSFILFGLVFLAFFAMRLIS